MPISVEWDDMPQTIVRWDFIVRWTWEDVRAALEKSISIRKSVEHKSAVILNFERSEALPMGAVTQMMQGMAEAPEKREMVVIAGSSGLLKSLTAIYLKVRRNQNDKVGLVENLEQARDFINKNRL